MLKERGPNHLLKRAGNDTGTQWWKVPEKEKIVTCALGGRRSVHTGFCTKLLVSGGNCRESLARPCRRALSFVNQMLASQAVCISSLLALIAACSAVPIMTPAVEQGHSYDNSWKDCGTYTPSSVCCCRALSRSSLASLWRYIPAVVLRSRTFVRFIIAISLFSACQQVTG